MVTQNKKILLMVRLLAITAVMVVGFRLAWLSDDSLITLRTALNITHGWGPGFNATESVQAYTHPLWFLLWVTIGVLTNQWVWGILLAGVFLTTGAVAVLVWRSQSIARIILVTGMLIFSNGFIEYSTSGLENPLAYISIAVGFALSVSVFSGKTITWWVLPLLTGLTFAAVFLTRFDLLVLFLPVGLLLAYVQRHSSKAIAISAGAFAIPVVVWFSWSWMTYHTWLPNTFAAKRNLDIPQLELAVQGFRYFYISFEHDPITLILLVAGIFGGLIFGNLLMRAWTLGVIIYLIYIMSVGGDFMASRFTAVPALVSALVLVSIVVRKTDGAKQVSNQTMEMNSWISSGIAMVALIFLILGSSFSGSTPVALLNNQVPRWEFEQNTNAGVSDERGFYVANGKGLKDLLDKLSLAYVNPDIAPLGDSSGLNRTLREISKAAQNWPYNDGTFTNPSEVGVFCGGLGYLGIATGPITHLVDACALTDRFLAEQPFAPAEPFAWRIGHFARVIPDGYVEAVKTGDPSRLVDPLQAFELGQLWQEIR